MSAEWADQPSLPDNDGVPGKILAAQREAMGWSVEQVADQLKLAVRQVVALEAGDYASLPGAAVVRGFVRAYAKVVKLDAVPLVAMIPLDTPSAAETATSVVRQNKPASFSEVRFPTNGKRQSTLPLGLIAGVVVLVGAAAAAWQFGVIPGQLLGGSAAPAVTAPAGAGGQASVTALPPPVVSTPGAMPAPDTRVVEELKPVISNSVPLISVPPATTTTAGGPAAAGVAPAGVAPVAPPAAAPLAAPAAATGNALVITVREDSWIEVRPAKGKALFSRLVKGGTVETVNVGEQPVTLIVGRPDAVTASLRGAPVELPAVPGGRVARVQLK